MRRREGAPPYVFYEGPPTANGRPGSHHVLARVFKDVFPRYKTMRGFYSERKGGWDCHGLPVEIAVQNQLGIESKAADRGIRDRGVQPEVPRVRVRVPRGLDAADRADRLLGRPRRIRTGRSTPTTSSRSGGRCASCGTRTCSTRASRSSRTARATARRCPATRSRRATRTSRTRASSSATRSTRPRGRAARGRHAARLDHDAVDAGLQRRRRRRPRAHVRPQRERRGAGRGARHPRARRGRADRRPLQGRRHDRRRLRAAVPVLSEPRSTARRATPCCPATSCRPRTAPGIVHTAIAFGEDDFRLGAEHGPERDQPGAPRRHVRRADRPVRRPLRQGRRRGPDRGSAQPRPPAPLRAPVPQLPALLALRHAAALLRQAVLVHRDLARSRTGCWRPTTASSGTPSTSRPAASGAGWRTTSTGR